MKNNNQEKPHIEMLVDPSFEVKFAKTLEVVKSAKNELIICSGEVSARYYDHPDMLEQFIEFLKRRGKIILSGGPGFSLEGTKNGTDADTELKGCLDEFKKTFFKPSGEIADSSVSDDYLKNLSELRPLFDLIISGIKDNTVDFRFFFSSKRNKDHFIVADQKTGIFFGHHKISTEPDEVIFFRNAHSIGEKLHGDFEKIIKKQNRFKFLMDIGRYITAQQIDFRMNFKKHPLYLDSEALYAKPQSSINTLYVKSKTIFNIAKVSILHPLQTSIIDSESGKIIKE